ncbi:MAG TPA: phytanoyl-CoA dioxygenase family protein, partial [Planctomycetaceae bacterium]|nr:phytanoyl-CoA dioxygenase family protein [Planctomycetaceae bacterium]
MNSTSSRNAATSQSPDERIDPQTRTLDRMLGELNSELDVPPGLLSALQDSGFVVIPHAVPPERLQCLVAAYNVVMASATGDDVRHGSTSTRVSDFVNRGGAFDDVYMLPALLRACGSVIGGPFKLSSFLSRSLRPGSAAQELHADVRRDSPDWPLVGFILMIDEFRSDNGATRFVPGSHRWVGLPEHDLADVHADHPQQLLACGPPGSLLVFNGSTWHGHTANRSDAP